MSIRPVLGSRAAIGGVLGSGRGGAAAWWLSGGVSAANAIVVYQPKGAASLAASYVNLANPGTYNAAPGVAPTLDANGWVFTGANTTGNWLDTGYVAPDNQARSCLIRFSDGLSGLRFLIDNYSSDATRFEIATTNTVIEYGNGNYQQRTPTATSGVLGFAGTRCYRNGTDEGGADIGAYSGTNIKTVRIGYTYFAGSLYRFGGKIQAVAIYNVTLSAAQVAAISSAMSALA